MSKIVLLTVTVLLSLYVLICFGMWAFQRSLQYFPAKQIEEPSAYGLSGFSDLRLASGDGTPLQAWHRPARQGFPTILYFQGNGGNIAGRAGFFRLMGEAGFGVLALSYRGYGASAGNPSEEGFYQDARALIAYAERQLSLMPDRILIYGESIGTGVAVQMATEYPVAGLVLQAPYTSITDLAAASYPWLPARLLLKDRFESLSKIPKVKAPLLLFHGELDGVVPVSYGRALFAAANEPKQAVFYPGVHHADFDIAELTRRLMDFTRQYALVAG
ncbi:alpha/beta hydrolase [Lacibacterium aquatile]|uniref:Alpha/beta hydrolase n=1 Tax=Lacibacterium aquatile TaxID=1168082 RepID=A0ABW5DQ00_9PROT